MLIMKAAVLALTELVFHAALLLLLLRILLQWVGADFYNPICQAIVRLTDPLLRPLRRIMPNRRRFDYAACAMLFIVEVLGFIVIALVYGMLTRLVETTPWPILLYWPIFGVLNLLLYIYFFAIIAAIILSWVLPGGGHFPPVQLIRQLTEPVLAQFRRIVPTVSGLDFSPMLALAAIYFARIVLRAAAEDVYMISEFVIGIVGLGD